MPFFREAQRAAEEERAEAIVGGMYSQQQITTALGIVISHRQYLRHELTELAHSNSPEIELKRAELISRLIETHR